MFKLSRWTRITLALLLMGSSIGATSCAVRSADIAEPSAPFLAAHAAGVAWLGPTLPGDVNELERWRRIVGPPVVVAARPEARPADRLVIVNWNMHVGGGDLSRLLAKVREQSGADVPIVFLLQEAYRSGPEVPTTIDRSSMFASLIRSLRRDGGRDEIDTVAAALGLHAYYVPSMRNGAPGISDEDRGNAILSTMPLSDLSAIELPFERQRRVAVAATVKGTTVDGRPWRLRLVSAHLDNMAGPRRLWFAGAEFGRARQARGLVTALRGTAPLVLGADMNSWFGFRDSAYTAAAKEFPQTRVTDRRATFRGLLRLDHLFYRLGDGWTASFRRMDDSFDSDHHPLIGTIDFSQAAAAPTTW
jgi:endonuclease/exonuclease/phosphatase family metal-dependent hydrolase